MQALVAAIATLFVAADQLRKPAPETLSTLRSRPCDNQAGGAECISRPAADRLLWRVMAMNPLTTIWSRHAWCGFGAPALLMALWPGGVRAADALEGRRFDTQAGMVGKSAHVPSDVLSFEIGRASCRERV